MSSGIVVTFPEQAPTIEQITDFTRHYFGDAARVSVESPRILAEPIGDPSNPYQGLPSLTGTAVGDHSAAELQLQRGVELFCELSAGPVAAAAREKSVEVITRNGDPLSRDSAAALAERLARAFGGNVEPGW